MTQTSHRHSNSIANGAGAERFFLSPREGWSFVVADAIVEFRNAVAFDAKYAEAHQELAKALDKQGKTQEAEAERAQAKALEAQSGEPASAP
jgi:hypothetical protein